mmetsp:Transcript_40875/g.87055  ORF Transcript_40875/g.87055 Transcript_40875/m.87055 type:complete len:344 (+) Transcript_40875:3-1034(+)
MSNFVAGKIASKKAEGMLAPLLESDDESSTGSDSEAGSDASSKEEKVKQTPMQKLKTLVAYGALGGGVVVSAGAMALAPAIAVFVMGGLCIANAPYSAYKEKQMSKIPTLRSMNNKLRDASNELGEQVDVLSEEIDALEPEADRAAAVEEELRGIAEKQNFNVNKLVELVQENGEILAQMRNNLRQRIVQDIIAIVVKSDRDNDNSIDRSEAKTLALRIRLSLQEYGVVFDTEKFLKAIGDDPTVQKVIGIVQKLLPSNKEKKENDDGSDSEDEEDDMYDMFYMAEDDVQGGAGRTTAGGGVSLMTCDKQRSRRGSMGAPRRSSAVKASKRSLKETVDSDDDY